MTRLDELLDAARAAAERQRQAEAAARLFCADCRWALAEHFGMDEGAARFHAEGPGVNEFAWDGDELHTQLAITVAGTEFRFPIRFRPAPDRGEPAVSLAGSEYVEYKLHGGVWRLAETVFQAIRGHLAACRHVEPAVQFDGLTLAPEVAPELRLTRPADRPAKAG